MVQLFASVPVTDIEDGFTRHGSVTMESQPWHDLLDWTMAHGLDPLRILASTGVTRDADKYQIRYTTFVYDDDGLRVLDPQPCDDDPCHHEPELMHVPGVEQGEAPPLPFPASIHLSAPTRPVATKDRQ